MRISDWSSDVCSSDLPGGIAAVRLRTGASARDMARLMDMLGNLALGIGVALTPYNLSFCLIGALVGTAIGVLPGLGPTATMALLLPITYYLPPEAALIMLAGIYRSEEHTSDLQSLMRISYAVFC